MARKYSVEIKGLTSTFQIYIHIDNSIEIVNYANNIPLDRWESQIRRIKDVISFLDDTNLTNFEIKKI